MRVRIGQRSVELLISDDGAGAARSEGGRGGALGGGRGIVGMRERVGLFGGELTAGPRPEGGFVVRAILPMTGAA